MAYDEELAERIRAVLVDEPELNEKKMFGGLGFMLDGNMAIAASGSGGLMVRIDPDHAPKLSVRPGAEMMVMGGKPSKGWLMVDAAALEEDEVLADWVSIGLDFASTLPPK